MPIEHTNCTNESERVEERLQGKITAVSIKLDDHINYYTKVHELLRTETKDGQERTKESLTLAINAHLREHDIRDRIFEEFKSSLLEKLHVMNNLKSQIDAERALYITRDFLDSKVDIMMRALEQNGVRLTTLENARLSQDGPAPAWQARLSDLERGRAGMQGGIAVWAVVGSAIMSFGLFALNLVANYLVHNKGQ